MSAQRSFVIICIYGQVEGKLELREGEMEEVDGLTRRFVDSHRDSDPHT